MDVKDLNKEINDLFNNDVIEEPLVVQDLEKNEDLTPEETSELEATWEKNKDAVHKINNSLKADGWEVQSFFSKIGVVTYASIHDIKVSIEEGKVGLSLNKTKMDLGDLEIVISSLESLHRALA